MQQSFFGHFGPRRRIISCVALLFLCTIAFFWRIIFTNEYTLFAQHDNAVVFYPWFQYMSQAIKHGTLPLWDPYTFSGHTFIGEMQQGVFYPLNLLMALWPHNARGLLPLSVIEGFVILAHFLAACFMFALARRLGLSYFGAVVAGLCFSLSGYTARVGVGYVNMLNGAIWLPLIFLAFIQALGSSSARNRIYYAMLAGILLGLTVLAGHHNAFVYSVVALAVYSILLVLVPERPLQSTGISRALKIIPLLTTVILVGIAASAVQLLPTLEYSQHAFRWIPYQFSAAKKIPYETTGYHQFMHPRDFIAFLFCNLFSGESETNPYFGVLPLLLVLYSLRHFRSCYPIKIFSLLILVILIYSLGHFSLLHGLSYVFIPQLNKAREAVRSLYLVHFSMAVLAGFGSDALIRARRKAENLSHRWFLKLVGIITAFSFLLIGGGYFLKVAFYGKPGDPNDDCSFFSLFLLIASVLIFYARHRHVLYGRGLKLAVLALLLLDFSFYNTWGFLLKSNYDGRNNLYAKELYKPNDTIRFLTARPGYFRVDIRDEALPAAVGQIYGLQTIFGSAVSAYQDYWNFVWMDYAPQGRPLSLLNAEYIVSKNPLPDLELIRDSEPKIYRNPHCLPRAWIVHTVEKAAGPSQMLDRILAPSFNPKAAAVTTKIPDGFMSGDGDSVDDLCDIVEYKPTRIGVKTKTTRPGLLVLSEIDYPGWQAYVNGKKAEIYRTDGILRGVFIEPGTHTVTFRYFPRSFKIGLALTSMTLTIFALFSIVRGNRLIKLRSST
jgi:hypothetical protein